MNKVKGNMYNWVTHTWNPIRGKCSHECTYCYMDRFWKIQKSACQVLINKELGTDLGQGNVIFVGSSTDMFADGVPDGWIIRVLAHCKKFDNRYLFQSKNPKRFKDFSFPSNTILGTTLESNKDHGVSAAPLVVERKYWITNKSFDVMISIEPILDFDPDIFVNWIREIGPSFVSIGADSKGHNLMEPSRDKVDNLVLELDKFTVVRLKDNIRRLR